MAGGKPKAHCIRGHKLTPENTYNGRSRRTCLACMAYQHERRRAIQARDNVARAPLAAIIEEWLERHAREHPPSPYPGDGTGHTGGMVALVFQTGIPQRTLSMIRTGRGSTHSLGGKNKPLQVEWITNELADRLLVGIGHPEYWWTRLEDVDRAA